MIIRNTIDWDICKKKKNSTIFFNINNHLVFSDQISCIVCLWKASERAEYLLTWTSEGLQLLRTQHVGPGQSEDFWVKHLRTSPQVFGALRHVLGHPT